MLSTKSVRFGPMYVRSQNTNEHTHTEGNICIPIRRMGKNLNEIREQKIHVNIMKKRQPIQKLKMHSLNKCVGPYINANEQLLRYGTACFTPNTEPPMMSTTKAKRKKKKNHPTNKRDQRNLCFLRCFTLRS